MRGLMCYLRCALKLCLDLGRAVCGAAWWEREFLLSRVTMLVVIKCRVGLGAAPSLSPSEIRSSFYKSCFKK